MDTVRKKRKTRKKLTPEELLMQQQRNQLRLKAIPDREKEEVSKFVARWISNEIDESVFGFSDDGPFSEDAMDGGDPVWTICSECYKDLWDGKWNWPEDRKLSTQLCYMAKSKMLHQVRDYLNRKKTRPELFTSHMTPEQLKEMEETANRWAAENDIRDRELGYSMAAEAVSKNALYLRYLEVLYDWDSYDFIAEKLNMEVVEVVNVEKKMLKFIKKKLKN